MPKAAISTEISGSVDDLMTPGKSGDISIRCYPNHVPPFVGQELDTLYANLYSSLIHFSINGSIRSASTYVARRGDRIVALFLFQLEKNTVRVLNEVIRVDAQEIERFTDYLFSTYREVSIILFRGIETNLRELKRPFQKFNYLEDIVLALPANEADYQTRLGKTTRRNMRRYLSRMEGDFPSFRYEFHAGAALEESEIREILDFNKARMASKGQVSNFDEHETVQIIARVKACGQVGIIRIDGRICAGAISYRVGSNYFLGVLAHDPAFDRYRPGLLCCYLTICSCIRRGGAEFHFLWGRYEFKYLLLGIRRDLDFLSVYRSSLRWFLNIETVLKNAISGYQRLARLWLQETRRRNGRVARLIVNPARRAVNFLKTGVHLRG